MLLFSRDGRYRARCPFLGQAVIRDLHNDLHIVYIGLGLEKSSLAVHGIL